MQLYQYRALRSSERMLEMNVVLRGAENESPQPSGRIKRRARALLTYYWWGSASEVRKPAFERGGCCWDVDNAVLAILQNEAIKYTFKEQYVIRYEYTTWVKSPLYASTSLNLSNSDPRHNT